ncbi:hypothetical protein Agabi119p4_11403 [Agaricus bisporus var. burnettii]|uniref:Uncharacterized protein n=1 Tax=Agaricus bisporus var. burnettii TaxID=192524 RepID=A0A8H7BZZ6_AGABI|nr:hypothetical protein Agabi119p4_11403 [Agaricus bisporus var. burnettii]
MAFPTSVPFRSQTPWAAEFRYFCDKCIGRPSSGHYDRHIIFVLLGGSNSLTFPIFLIYNSHPPCLLILTCIGLGFAKIIGYLVRFKRTNVSPQVVYVYLLVPGTRVLQVS